MCTKTRRMQESLQEAGTYALLCCNQIGIDQFYVLILYIL